MVIVSQKMLSLNLNDVEVKKVIANKVKRVIYFAIICAVVLSVINITTYAEGKTSSHKLAEKIAALGVFNIVDFQFENQKVTRRDMAKITVEYLNIQASDAMKTPFIDVAVGSDGSNEIAELYARGLIEGSASMIFSPERYVTVDEALAFLINASGYSKIAKMKGGFPNGYYLIAKEHNILERLCHQGNQEADIDDILVIMDGMLQAPAVKLRSIMDDKAEYELSKDTTVMNELYDIYVAKGIVTANQYTALTSEIGKSDEDEIEINGMKYTVSEDLSDLLGCSVEYYYADVSEPKIYYIEEKKANVVLKIGSDDILQDQTTNTQIAYQVDSGKTKTKTIETDADVIYNQISYTGYGSISEIIPDDGWIELIDNDGDNCCEVVKIIDLKTIVVMGVDTYECKIVEKPHNDLTQSITLDLNENDHKVVYKNSNFSFKDIKPDMVLTVAQSADASLITVYVSEEKYTYALDRTKNVDGKMIPILDGEEYQYVHGYPYGLPAIGNTYTFFLDFLGRIAYVQSEVDETAWKIGVLARVGQDTAKQQILVEIFNAEGEFVTGVIKNKVTINDVVYKTNKVNSADEMIDMLQSAAGGAIQFKMDGEQNIKKLELPQKSNENDDVDLRILAEGNSLRVRNGMVADAQGTFYMGNALAFSVPSDANELEQYQVFDLMSMVRSGHNYINYNGTGNYDHYIPDFKYIVYANAGEPFSVKNANVVVLTNYHMNTEITKFSDIYVVAENGTAVNHNDETVNSLVLYSNSNINGLTSTTVNYVNENQNVTMEEIGLQPGDVIVAGKNSQDEISRIEVIWRYQGETNLPQRITNDTSCYVNGSGFDAESVIAYAKIKAIDRDNSLIEYVSQVEKNDWLAQTNSGTVYLVVAENAKGSVIVERGSSSDLSYNDTVIVRAKTGVANLIVILKDK